MMEILIEEQAPQNILINIPKVWQTIWEKH